LNIFSPGIAPTGEVTPAAPGRAKPSVAKSWLKAIELTARIDVSPTRLLADLVEDHAEKAPERAAILSDWETFTYAELAAKVQLVLEARVS